MIKWGARFLGGGDKCLSAFIEIIIVKKGLWFFVIKTPCYGIVLYKWPGSLLKNAKYNVFLGRGKPSHCWLWNSRKLQPPSHTKFRRPLYNLFIPTLCFWQFLKKKPRIRISKNNPNPDWSFFSKYGSGSGFFLRTRIRLKHSDSPGLPPRLYSVTPWLVLTTGP